MQGHLSGPLLLNYQKSVFGVLAYRDPWGVGVS